MHTSIELKGLALGLATAIAVLGLTFATAAILQPRQPPKPSREPRTASVFAPAIATRGPAVAAAEIERGRKLFLQNCAHCHGDDARGEEGPDLHGVKKSDSRIANLIQNGIPGEMPRFGSKLDPADVRALIAFVRSLQD